MTISLSYRHDLPEMVGGKRTSGQLTAPFAHSEFVLMEAMNQLGIKPSELCRLVGRRYDNSKLWFNGSNAPSQAYWVRISYVQTLALSGINLKRIRTIDWATTPFRIEWNKGAEPKEEQVNDSRDRPKSDNAVRDAWWDIPSPESDGHV